MTTQPAPVEDIIVTASGLTFGALAVGQADGPVVLCLHGFPDGPSTFVHQFEPLATAGYRVIAPTLRGYEPSSIPTDGDYTLSALADDLIGWLDHLDVPSAHLVGHDWGAAIVHVAAARNPERVLTATTIAVPPLSRIPDAVRRVPRQLQRSWYMTFFQLPMVAERAVVADDWRLIRRLWRDWSPGYTMVDEDWARLRDRFGRPGVVEAMLGYYRQNATPPILLGLRPTPEMELREVPVPMLVLHGADDGCMDPRLFDHTVKRQDFPAGIRRIEVDDAGHFVHLEQPEPVNRAILDHLSG